MNSYDIKFRTKVVTYIKAGHTQAEAARKFGLNPHTVCNWIKLINENKGLRPILVPRGPHKLPREKLVEYVKEHPDALLENIATHFKCARSTIHKTLRNLGIRRKKKQNYTVKETKPRDKNLKKK